MKIVIDIPEEEYQNYLKMKPAYPKGVFCYIKAIQNGTPLPKEHGRLIDAKEVYKKFYCRCLARVAKEVLDEIPTIIEADKGEEE